MILDEEKDAAPAVRTPEPGKMLVLFLLDDQRFALPLSAVEKIVRLVEVTPLPNAPPFVLGVIDVAGAILPVLDMRRRLNIPVRAPALRDQLLIVRTSRRRVALLADSAGEVVVSGPIVPAPEIVPGFSQIHGVTRLQDGLVLIHDPDRLLSPEEEAVLDSAPDDVVNP